MLTSLLLFLTIFSCSIGEQNTVPENTPKARALEQLQVVADQSSKVEQAALELESAIDESRRAITNGEPQETQSRLLEALFLTLEAENKTLQAEVEKLERLLSVAELEQE